MSFRRNTSRRSAGAIATSFAILAACVLGSAALAGALAGPASAHSELTDVSPQDGASLDAGPDEVVLTFNEPLQEAYAALTVVSSDGNLWQDGEPRVDGSRLIVELRELGPAGTYTINYRVTSADGHPVSGQTSFELTVPGEGAPGEQADVEAADSDEGGIPLWPFIVGAVVLVGAGIGVVLLLGRRAGTK